MSFSMTTAQIIDRTKTVTRRFGWWNLKPGDKIQAVRKCQGLRKGEKIEPLAIIEIVSVRTEPLNAITKDDCVKEGFPEFAPSDFVEMLCNHYSIKPDKQVNRIEFRYL